MLLVEENPRTTIREIPADLNVSHITVSRHLKAFEKVKKKKNRVETQTRRPSSKVRNKIPSSLRRWLERNGLIQLTYLVCMLLGGVKKITPCTRRCRLNTPLKSRWHFDFLLHAIHDKYGYQEDSLERKLWESPPNFIIVARRRARGWDKRNHTLKARLGPNLKFLGREGMIELYTPGFPYAVKAGLRPKYWFGDGGW